MRLLKILGIVLLVAGLLTALMPGAGAQASQTWYFTDADAPPPFNTAGDLNKIMTKGTEGAVGTIITLEPGKRVWFYSDETAVVDVAFPAGRWDVRYWVKALHADEAGDGRVFTRVGFVDSGGTPTRVSGTGASEAITSPGVIEEIVEGWLVDNDISFTVPEGGRLAIEVLWGSAPLGDLEIHLNPAEVAISRVISPPSDPGYPVLELSTIILFSTGLLLLGGYVWLKRRRACLQPQS